MAKIIEIKNVDAVLHKLMLVHKEGPIAQRVENGIKKAGLFLQRVSQEIVPVDTGNLKASAFTRKVSGEGFSTDVVVGYTAEYAVFVHEDLNKLHGADYNTAYAKEIENGASNRGENQQAKFLETPAREKRNEIIKIIAVG